MLTKLKLYAGIAVTALIAFLGAMVSIRTNQRDKAEAEKEKVESDLDKVIQVNESNQKSNEVLNEIKKASSKVDSASNSDVDGGMRKYDRSSSDSD